MVALPDRPLALGEIVAETIRHYGERPWPALGLGLIYSVIPAAAGLIHLAVYYAVASLMVILAYGVAARLLIGDSFGEAWAQVAIRSPVLLVLALIVGLPFVLAPGLLFLLGLFVAALWIGLTGFAVPVAVVEPEGEERGWPQRVAYALERTVVLARAEYLHAAGVAAALLLVNFLVAYALAGALAGFADNSRLVAAILAQIVLAPFFFIGLSVLYFEQCARLRAGPARDARAGRA